MSARLYFAYGSNMSREQVRQRCPGARLAGRAQIDGWRFYLTTRGTASIVRDGPSQVWGVLWRLGAADIHRLDGFEGLHWGNYFKRDFIVLTKAGPARAFSYISLRQRGCRARPGYMETAVLPGARQAGLPAHYVRELEGWIRRRPIGVPATPYTSMPRRVF